MGMGLSVAKSYLGPISDSPAHDGQGNLEGRPAFIPLAGTDLATVGLDDCPAQGEPDTHPGLLAREECLEEPLHVLGSNSRAIVEHRQLHRIAVRSNSHGHQALSLCL